MNNSSFANETGTSPNGIAGLSFTPLLAPNVIFLVIFVMLLAMSIASAIRFRHYYGYAIGMFGGLLLELLGYVAKVQLSSNPRHKDAYIMYIIGLTLGPTFLSSSLYLNIAALQRNYQTRFFGSIGPRSFTTLFILGDFICLCFIGCGGSLAAIFAENPIGVDLMIAGLATQVLFTAIFCTCLFVIYRKAYMTLVVDSRLWIVRGMAVASVCLFIRSCWRVAELSGGFNGPLASKEDLFIALDSVPMVIMSLLLTALHPELWFRSGYCKADFEIDLLRDKTHSLGRSKRESASQRVAEIGS